MATTNGDVASPINSNAAETDVSSADASSITKRKREDGDHEIDPSRPQAQQVQRDILTVLQGHDTDPSFLNHQLNGTEPAQKKAKMSSPSDTSPSLATKLRDGIYTDLHQIKVDASRVSEELTASIRASAKDKDGANAGRLSVEELKQIHKIDALEWLVKETVDQEVQYRDAQALHLPEPRGELEAATTNGHADDPTDDMRTDRAGTVLTLFGNAPNPRQLFSSMQNTTSEREPRVIKNELPVEEMSLPNGLSATKILPVRADESKKGLTIEDAFASPYNLPTLNPPKVHKRSSTRDGIVRWEFKDSVQRNKKGGYTVQSLNVADWLSYAGAEPTGDTASPLEKRKQRDRALSGGESPVQEGTKSAISYANAKEEEESLFRRAFSSFAPSCDNGKALVPEEIKNMVWWQKIGNRRFNDTFCLDPALRDNSATSPAMPTVDEPTFQDDDFDKVLDELDEPDDTSPDFGPVRSKTDVEQCLQGISELLETLASYQRIRNASLPSSTAASRTPISPTPPLASSPGKPDEPAEDEMIAYGKLRRELAYLILKLPPYALAKVNGEQLEELGISRLITFAARDIQGTMEEDQVSRQAKLAALSSAASVASLARPTSSAGPHYNSTAQRTPAIGQAAKTRYGQSSQYGARSSTAALQYQRGTNQQYYNTPTARPSYGQPNQHTRPTASQTGYGQYYQQRSLQQSTGGYGSYSTQYYQTPQTQQRSNYPQTQPPQQQYQQRFYATPNAATTYQNSSQQNTYNHAASPPKPSSYTPQMQQPGQQQQQQHSQAGNSTLHVETTGAHVQSPVVNGYQESPRPVSAAPRPISTTPQPLPSASPPPAPPPPAMAQTN